MKWLFVLVALAVIVVVTVAFWVTRVENYQYDQNQTRLNKSRIANGPSVSTAVVVFSRSGNTGVMAQHIADTTGADLYEIFAEDYALGIPGLVTALSDARKTIATITPNEIDLTHYDRVYLGSPIWLYSPAPPIWQFAKQSDFTGKQVVLFNTFNSKFEQRFIDAFERLVVANGANSFEHRYVNRGRMGTQMSTEEMLRVFDSGNQ